LVVEKRCRQTRLWRRQAEEVGKRGQKERGKYCRRKGQYKRKGRERDNKIRFGPWRGKGSGSDLSERITGLSRPKKCWKSVAGNNS
jgi:hypothetical protein